MIIPDGSRLVQTSALPPIDNSSIVAKDRVQHTLLDAAARGNGSGCLVALLLNRMAGMTARPAPGHVVSPRRIVEPFPEIEVGLAFEEPGHGLYDILRVGNYLDLTGLDQRFEAKTGGDNLCLLICSITKILTEDFAPATIFEYRGGSGPWFLSAVAQTASIADDLYYFHYQITFIITAHSVRDYHSAGISLRLFLARFCPTGLVFFTKKKRKFHL
jgi:hypothetical protein